jgi:hypothetical protein
MNHLTANLIDLNSNSGVSVVRIFIPELLCNHADIVIK